MLRRHHLLWVPLLLSAGCSDDDAGGRPGTGTDQPGTGADTEASATDAMDSESSGGGGGATGEPPQPTGGDAPCVEGDACPPGAACVAPAGCASGFCVDGICCDTACEGACESCAPAGTCTAASPETQPECAAGWVLGLGAPVDVEEAPNTNFDRGTSIAVDEEGNIYLVGTYNQQVDFGGGVSTAGSDDPFVASYTAEGAYRWHTQFGGTGHDTGGGVAVIPGTNEIVVVGAVTGDPGLPGDWPKTGLRGFVAKFDRTSGAVAASRALDATEFSRANAVAVDATGIYVAGGFQGTFEVGIPRVSVGDEDMFAVRLDAALQPTWNWADGDTGKDLGRAIAVNASGDIALTGYVSASEDSQDIIVTSFTSPLGAAPAWRNLYASPPAGAAKGHSVAWTPEGDVIMTGFFTGPVTFGQTSPDGGGRDAVLMRLTGATGITDWAITFGGPGDDTSRSVAVDPATGNLFVAGDFSDSVVIGGPLTSTGGKDIFVGLFMADGTPAWTRGYGGVSNDNGNGVALAPNGSLYASGHFRENAVFDEAAMVAAEGADIFLMRTSP